MPPANIARQMTNEAGGIGGGAKSLPKKRNSFNTRTEKEIREEPNHFLKKGIRKF